MPASARPVLRVESARPATKTAPAEGENSRRTPQDSPLPHHHHHHLNTNTTNNTNRTYADAAGAETAAKYQTPIFLAASASAEFFADMALAPFEAVKVAVQTRPGFAKGLFDGMPKLVQAEGAGT